MKYLVNIIIVISLFVGCKNNDYNGQFIEDWPETVQLEGTSILAQELGLLYVSLVDTLLARISHTKYVKQSIKH
ncbi:MAG: hypothetical protein JJU13_05050 [Balneolaceae bacterium]|nr:hypothetical protein [Balneolaceae bacterium]